MKKIAPKHLDSEAKKLWVRLRDKVNEPSILEAYCSAYSLYVDAIATVNKEGRYCHHPNGTTYLHPAMTTIRNALSAMNQLSQRLGLNKLEVEKETATDKWGGLLEFRA